MQDFDQEVGAIHLRPPPMRPLSSPSSQLRNFSHAARQLGSCVGLLSSAFHLRDRAAQVLYLFNENAASLFPKKVQHRDASAQANSSSLGTKRGRPKPPPYVRTPVIKPDGLDPEDFPEQVSHFSEEVTAFLGYLNEFPEFTDETVNTSILRFRKDLQVGFVSLTMSQYLGRRHFR